MSNIILIWLFDCLGLCLLGTWRNVRVYRFQMGLIDRCRRLNIADIEAGRMKEFDSWRYDALNAVSYNQMLFKFWKPLRVEAWYRDLSFLEVSK